MSSHDSCLVFFIISSMKDKEIDVTKPGPNSRINSTNKQDQEKGQKEKETTETKDSPADGRRGKEGEA